MTAAARILAGLIAVEHLGFLILEMFLWTKPIGLKIFGQTAQAAAASATLAMNQGLYNGFLAAGLIWGLLAAPGMSAGILTFFLGCVTVAGLFGGATASRSILLVQALPAAAALILLRCAR